MIALKYIQYITLIIALKSNIKTRELCINDKIQKKTWP